MLLVRRRLATTAVSQATSLNNRFVEKALEQYKGNKLEVDKELEKLFTSNRIVLFSEGTVDAPKSELSLNVVKMLTEMQSVPLVQVDVLQHPAIMGFTVHKSGSYVTPHLYVNGSFYGDHDRILQKYKTGELKTNIGTSAKVPIALY